jgi:pre-rRNA-processing protein IPI3
MNEIIVVTSSKDSGGGAAVIDLTTGTSVCSNFKNCITEPGAACIAGSGYSSFSGSGSCGDYVAVAQAKKPVIHIYQWGKPQVLHQCHVQEITTSLASDPSGCYLFGGTKRGWIYVWEVNSGALITSWQAHFKTVTKVEVVATGDYLVSASEDGMVRVWELALLLDQSESLSRLGAVKFSANKKSFTPYRYIMSFGRDAVACFLR